MGSNGFPTSNFARAFIGFRFQIDLLGRDTQGFR
jgi:hypothetical protein